MKLRDIIPFTIKNEGSPIRERWGLIINKEYDGQLSSIDLLFRLTVFSRVAFFRASLDVPTFDGDTFLFTINRGVGRWTIVNGRKLVST